MRTCFNYIFIGALSLLIFFKADIVHCQDDIFLENENNDDYVLSKKLGLEKNFEERLERDISSYLGNNNFIIQVRVWLKNIKIRKQVEPNRFNTIPEPMENRENRDRFEEEEIYLPGIPVVDFKRKETPVLRSRLPRRNVNIPQPFAPQVKQKIVISKINVKVILDRDIAGEKEEFVRGLIYQKAHLNSARGDKLVVEKTGFPKPPGEVEKEDVTQAPELPEKTEEFPSGLIDEVAVDKFFEYLDYFKYVLPLIAAVTLLIIIFLVKFIGKKKAMPERNMYSTHSNAPAYREDQSDSLRKATEASDARIESERIKKDTIPIKQEIVSVVLEYPKIGLNVIKKIIENEDGVRKAAILFKTIGFQASDKLFQGLPPDQRSEIESYFTIKRNFAPEEVLKVVENAYYSLLSEKAQVKDRDIEVKPFNFLKKLDDSQVIFILNDEGIKVKTLVFAQLPPESAVRILKKLPVDQQGRIAEAIGDFGSIPVATFKDVADRLSKKAMNAPNFATLTSDGLGLLIELLDNSDSLTEQRILDSLSHQNPDMLKRVKEIYFTFSDIHLMPAHIMKDVFRDMDRTTLAIAMTDIEDEGKERIYGSLPEKMGIILKDNVDNLKNIETVKVEAAKQDIVSDVRLLLKSGKFSMSDIRGAEV